jgi:hypothetical protein
MMPSVVEHKTETAHLGDRPRHTGFGLFVVLVLFVVPTTIARSEPPTKLSREELAARQQKADNNPVQLLKLCLLADDRAAQELRTQVRKLLVDIAVGDRAEIARTIAAVLVDIAPTPDETLQILGAPHQVSRQVVYRRCVEQWHYEQPLPLCLVWSIPRGENPHLHNVRSISEEKR